ncbi:MAG: endonuclease V [Candidatus Bathyarchaeia archaeon]
MKAESPGAQPKRSRRTASRELEGFLALAERWRRGEAKTGDLAEAQRAAAGRLVFEDRFERPLKAIAGVDASFLGHRAFAAAVVLDYESATVLEERTTACAEPATYLPGLLVFREGPVMVEAVQALETPFQVLMVNSHGLAHPRRCGAASHIGLLLDTPTIGVAASLLCGKTCGSPKRPGEWLPVLCDGETVGAAGIPAPGMKPIYISPGHMISVGSSVEITARLLRGKRLPEPLAVAHAAALRARDNSEKFRSPTV